MKNHAGFSISQWSGISGQGHKDEFTQGQLDDYIEWVKKSSNEEQRTVVLLTANPLKKDELRKIKDNSDFISHLYLSKYTKGLLKYVGKSDLIAMFADYLSMEGYAMYQLLSSSKEGRKDAEADYRALLSFMVLNFLPHNSGKGKVAAAKKIARGPTIFGSIVQNWQLVSDQFAVNRFGAQRRPTVLYWPEQATSRPSIDYEELQDDSIFENRWKKRNSKNCGRFWLTASIVLVDKLRIEWGQVIEVQRGNDGNGIECSLYVRIHKKSVQYAGSFEHLKKHGILDHKLYDAEAFLALLGDIFNKVRDKAISENQDLKSILKNL